MDGNLPAHEVIRITHEPTNHRGSSSVRVSNFSTALPELLLRELAAIHRKLDLVLAALPAASAQRRMSPEQCNVVDALHRVFGTGAVTSREVLAACEQEFGERPALRAALTALVDSWTVQRVGLALRAIVEAGGQTDSLLLSTPKTEGNRRVWCVGVLRDYHPPKPPAGSMPDSANRGCLTSTQRTR